MPRERLRDRNKLVVIRVDHSDAVADHRASGWVRDNLQAAIPQALRDLPLEVAGQLLIERDGSVGQDQLFVLLARLRDVVEDQRVEPEGIEIHG